MVEAPPQQQESETRCHPEILEERARHAEQTLPEIARRLFTLDPADPLADLPNAQLKVCSLLLNGERTMSQVSEELNISVSAVTQIADRLEKANLVARHAAERDGDGDRRTRYLALTARGAARMRSRREWRVGRVAAALARLSDTDQAHVVVALDVLLSACRQSGDGGQEA